MSRENGETAHQIDEGGSAGGYSAANYGNWRVLAECRDEDPTRFIHFTDDNLENKNIRDSYNDAKRVCRICQVRADCLEFALETNSEYGLWGGLSTTDLKKARSAYRRARNPEEKLAVVDYFTSQPVKIARHIMSMASPKE